MAKHLGTIIHRPDLLKPIKPTFGLGDLVASVAQPVAKAIDAVAGTNVAGCGGCKARQEALNRMVPDLTRPLK
jgi:hypothetical protein